MSVHKTLRVELGKRSYEIQVGNGLLPSAGERIKPYLMQNRAIIITDENVAKLHLNVLKNSLVAANIRCHEIVLPAGEKTKDFNFLKNLVSELLELNVERSTTLLALGGGVTGDLTGFTAAILLRGIDFIQIPTTLLSQVDSSVGGKTGINTRHGKNLVGAFYQPKLVIADIDSLDTLAKREILAGYAEIAKYGLINNAKFFEWLEENGAALCEGNRELRKQAVIISCQTKANIVSTDERETGDRALLNLGHTFGHALEAEAGFSNRLLHGEAVAIGIVIAIDLSVRMGLCSKNDLNKVRNHFREIGLPIGLKEIAAGNWSAEGLIKNMLQDKKAEAGNLAFILSGGIGNSLVSREVSHKDLIEILTCYLDV